MDICAGAQYIANLLLFDFDKTLSVMFRTGLETPERNSLPLIKNAVYFRLQVLILIGARSRLSAVA